MKPADGSLSYRRKNYRRQASQKVGRRSRPIKITTRNWRWPWSGAKWEVRIVAMSVPHRERKG